MTMTRESAATFAAPFVQKWNSTGSTVSTGGISMTFYQDLMNGEWFLTVSNASDTPQTFRLGWNVTQELKV